MEKAATGLIVRCTDIADAHELKVITFIDTMDEIEVTTPVYNDALKRGWIGDLSFQTYRTVDFVSCHDAEPVRDGYKDVLLASVRVWDADPESGVVWKYRFLKK